MPAPILQRRWHTIANQIPNMLICSAVEIMIYSVAQNYLDDGSYPGRRQGRGTGGTGLAGRETIGRCKPCRIVPEEAGLEKNDPDCGACACDHS